MDVVAPSDVVADCNPLASPVLHCVKEKLWRRPYLEPVYSLFILSYMVDSAKEEM